MNVKSSLSILNITRRVIFNFSKNPFDKFNKNKPKANQQPQKTDPTVKDKEKNEEKAKTGRQDKSKPFKFSAKTFKPNDLNNSKEEPKQEQVSSSAFKRFGQRHKVPTNTQQEKGQRLNSKDTQKKQEATTNEEIKKQSHPQEDYTIKNKRTRISGFSKFSKQSLKSEAQKEEKGEKQKEETSRRQKKNQSFQKITLQLKDDELQIKDKGKQPIILRKPKHHTRKNAEPRLETQQQKQQQEPLQKQQQKQEPALSRMSQQQEKNPEPELTPEQKKLKQLWDKLQQLVSEKLSKNQAVLRINRFDWKKASSRHPKTQKTANSQPENIINRNTMLWIVMASGVGLYILSSGKYIKWDQGKEVDPQYLKQALNTNRIQQTWFQNTEIDSNDDDAAKGRNIQRFVYIQQANGQLSFCISNQQFQKVWLEMIENYNMNTNKRTGSEMYLQNNNEFSSAEKKITVGVRRQSKRSNLVSDTRSILSMILLFLFIKSMKDMSKGVRGKGGKGISNLFENQKSHRFKETISVTFKDVVGMQKAKEEIVQFIDFLKFPAKYNQLGAKIPKGALLTGPPGTGKTMMAKACAGESKVPFYTISGSEFIEMYVGVGAQRVRNLFKQAKQNAPSIIFIDEIDAVGKKRSGIGGNDERDTTLNQLLVQMDGFDTNTNVIVFAATNQKEVLDAALTRPGRFDRMIEIDLPDLEGRREIFQVHLKPIHLDEHIEIKQYARRLATLTPGFSGADIKNVCNEAAIIAARNNKQSVSIMDFQLATERIIGGVQKKSQLITPETRKVVAYHECGHGVVSWFIKNANPLLKLTIIPRSKGALGFAQYLPNQHQMFTKVKLMDEICVILGGRVAEQVFFNKISTGASDDLNKAYDIAKTLITSYGFSDQLGWISYNETEYTKEYSKQIEAKIDTEILEIMKTCTERTRKLIIEKKTLINTLAQKLLELQTIDQTIIQSILGERPFKASKQHQEYIRERKRLTEDILNQENKQGGSEPTVRPHTQTSQKAADKINMKRSDYLL